MKQQFQGLIEMMLYAKHVLFSLSEQEAIARYLDQETAKID
jgi:hypothetical protein